MVGTTPVYSQTGSYSKSPAAHFLTQRVWRDVGERAENFDLDEADEEEDDVEDGEEALLGSGSDLDDTRAERAGAGTHGAGRRHAKREREVSLSSVSTKSGQHGLVPSGSGTSPRPLENASQPASARPRRRRRHSSTHSGSLGTSLTRSGVDHSKPHRSLSPNELPQIVLHKDRHDEERPLLLHGEELVDALEEITEQMPDDVKQARDHGASVRNELSSLLRYTAPIAASFFLQYSLQIASVFSLGHLGTQELAAGSLGSMTAAVSCFAVVQGVTTSLDTLCSQAFTSGRPHLVGVHLQRMLLLNLLLLLPMAPVFFQSREIFILLRQEPFIAEYASLYLRALVFGIPGYMVFECVKRYLQSQGIMHASTLCVLVVAPVNIFLNWILVWGPPMIRLGFVGAPLATAVSYTLLGLLIALYASCLAPKTAWGGWSREVWKYDSGWKELAWLSISGTMMTASEWWAWEFCSLAASQLGPEYLAAQSILITTCSLTFQIPFAMSVAATTRIGNLLGAGLAEPAKLCSHVATALPILVGATNSVILLASRSRWGMLFDNDPVVVGIVSSILPLCALFQIVDGLAAMLGGILRGCGRQGVGSVITIFSYYLVALPLSIYITFFGPRLGLLGLWTGLTLALFIITILSAILLFARTDWQEQVNSARRRLVLDAQDQMVFAREHSGRMLHEGRRDYGTIEEVDEDQS